MTFCPAVEVVNREETKALNLTVRFTELYDIQ